MCGQYEHLFTSFRSENTLHGPSCIEQYFLQGTGQVIPNHVNHGQAYHITGSRYPGLPPIRHQPRKPVMLQGDAPFTAPELAICFAPAAAPGVAECAVYPPIRGDADDSVRPSAQCRHGDIDVDARCAPITFCARAQKGNARRGCLRSHTRHPQLQFGRSPRPFSSRLRKIC